MQVKKRDGRIKDFSENRIIEVITKAYQEVYAESYVDYQNEIKETADKSVAKIIEINENPIFVEKIQDVIIANLKTVNKKVAKSYVKYRTKREEERERNSRKEKFYKEILQTSNTDNDNANVDQYSFSGRKYRIADNEQKTYALRNLISPDVREAFEDGYIYVHDASSYSIGESNCLFADLPRLLNNGFSTRNGDVRPANSFSTACQLVAVIFQIQSQIQYGGVASCGIDFELEPFAHKSFVKLFKEGLLEKEYITENSYNKLKNGENVKTIDGELVDVINIHIDNYELNEKFPKAYDYAIRHLEKEGKQSAQGLFHNLNTLESRAGSQVKNVA